MSLSLRAAMANIGLVALFLGGWITASGWYIAIATALFLLLVLATVANAILDTGHRPYWIGSAVVSCGMLLFSNHLPIFDAIAHMADQRQMVLMPPPSPMSPTYYVPPTAVAPNTGYSPYNPSNASGSSMPVTVTVVPRQPALWSFAQVTNADGYTNVIRAFLICSASYFFGLIGGLICSRMCVVIRCHESQS